MSKHKFKIGERVKPSYKGIRANVFMPKYWEASGVVTRVDKSNSPTVLWDHRKATAKYAAEFIDVDWREWPEPKSLP